ncbi:MFS transporter [Pseudonocardia adelaidensis]|uniref:MFS transporter n=1 Tax=Pseudonocardia adelaidensis TaxID=648754 RepID=A0ABP9NCG7_9PSEU
MNVSTPVRPTRTLRQWQVQVFAVSWITYAAFYFPRSAFSAAKVGILGDPAVNDVLTKQMLGNLDALYLAAYAVGQFVWGAVAERWGTRVVVTGGMILAGVAAIFMGLGTALWLFAPLMIVQGLAQATGWAALSKNIASFFTVSSRGRAMGMFSTSYAFGGLVAAPVAGWIAYGLFDSWRVAFLAGGGIILVLLLVFLALQRNDLRECGLPDIDVIDSAQPAGPPTTQRDEPEQRRRVRPADLLAAARHDSMVLRLGLSYFLLKPARYAILLWGPVLVLQAVPGIDKVTAVLVPIAFGVAGLVAPIALGWISDTVFGARRVPVCVLSLVLLIGVLCLWGPLTSSGSIWLISTALALIGLAAYGADAMISGVAAVDFGTSRHAAGSAGFINGCGSVGAILGGLLPGYFGPTALFFGFAVASAVAAAILAPHWNRRPISA